MPLEIYRRGGVWHCRGTIGPDGRRKRIRQSLHTKNKDTARAAAEIEKKYWDGHFDGPAVILTFSVAARLYRNAGRSDPFLPAVESISATRWSETLRKPSSNRWRKTFTPTCREPALTGWS